MVLSSQITPEIRLLRASIYFKLKLLKTTVNLDNGIAELGVEKSEQTCLNEAEV